MFGIRRPIMVHPAGSENVFHCAKRTVLLASGYSLAVRRWKLRHSGEWLFNGRTVRHSSPPAGPPGLGTALGFHSWTSRGKFGTTRWQHLVRRLQRAALSCDLSDLAAERLPGVESCGGRGWH